MASAQKETKETLEETYAYACSTLQAVVVVDSFQKKFKPVTVEKPKALFPLLNIPLLAYTVEFLTLNRVKEIFLATTSHKGQIQKFIKN